MGWVQVGGAPRADVRRDTQFAADFAGEDDPAPAATQGPTAAAADVNRCAMPAAVDAAQERRLTEAVRESESAAFDPERFRLRSDLRP